MTIRRSSEVEAVVARWLDAQVARRGATLENLLSGSEHVRYIGSDEGELWDGPLLRQGFAAHIAEVPAFTFERERCEGFERGEVGWAGWVGTVTFPDLASTRTVRFSWVLTLEDGIWRIVHAHVSFPVPNVEVFGRDHFAFAALLEEARDAPELLAVEGAATILFTDIANSSQIAAMLGDRSWAAVVGRHIAGQADTIARRGGAVVKTLGDGAMAHFGSAAEAARAAVEIQRANAARTDEPTLALRIGIHSGSVIETRGDFFGTVVNKAARIASIAAPGEILLSAEAAALLDDPARRGLAAPVDVALRGVGGQHRVQALDWGDGALPRA